jgi:hypothetical protein
VADLAEYLDLTVSQAREQFQALLARRPVPHGRQVAFLPVETLLCLAASFLVNHRRYGGGTAHRAPEPVPIPGPVVLPVAVQRAGDTLGDRSKDARIDQLWAVYFATAEIIRALHFVDPKRSRITSETLDAANVTLSINSPGLTP